MTTFLIFGFMIRHDVVYVIIPLFFFLILYVTFQKTWTLSGIIQKIKKITSFTLPLLLGYEFERTIEAMRYSVEATTNIVLRDELLIGKFSSIKLVTF